MSATIEPMHFNRSENFSFVTSHGMGNSTDDIADITTLQSFNIYYFMNATHKIALYQAALVLENCSYYALPVLALFLNCLTVATMCRLKPFTSTSLYICVLAACDTIVLLLKMLLYVVDIQDIQIGDYGCGVLAFAGNTFLYVAVWTIVVMTIERFVAVIYPLQVSSLFTMRKTKLSILILFTSFALANAHFIYTHGLRSSPIDKTLTFCGPRLNTVYWSRKIWFWINTVLFAALPCSCLMFLNIAIIVGMKSSYKKQKQMTVDTSRKDAQQRQVTIMLLVMSFAYIVFFVPVCICMIYLIDFNFYESPSVFSRMYFTSTFVYFLSSLNHAVNFFFYFASNSRFRQALYQLITCKAVSGKKSNTALSVNTVSSAVSTRSSASSTPDVSAQM